MFKRRNVKGATRQKVIRRDSSDSSDDSDSDNGHRVVTKRAKKAAQEITSDISNQSSSVATETKDATLTKNDKATKMDALNQELIDQDRIRKYKESKDEGSEDRDDGIYRGQSNYTSFIKPTKGQAMDKIGPKKASSNIRSTTVFDFQRDVCKDYKQTGFCGYGDSCKFLHARDDFKAGWKLNKDWDLETKNKESKIEKELQDIPFKCAICKKDYKIPIKTRCDHYFCEMCFLNRSRKNQNCFICGKNTNGVAAPAKNLQAVLKGG